MKNLTRIIISILLFFAFLTPVIAKDEIQKVYRNTSSHFLIFDFDEGRDLFFEIYQINEDPVVYNVQYSVFYQNETMYSYVMFTSEIPFFPFNGAMNADQSLSQCMTGEEQGYTYYFEDGTETSYIISDVERCVDIDLVFQSQQSGSYLDHERSMDYGKLVFHSKFTSYSYSVEGFISDYALNNAYASVEQSSYLIVVPQMNKMMERLVDRITHIETPIQFKTEGFLLEAFNIGMDSVETPIRYISVVDYDLKDQLLQINMEAFLYNDIGEPIGSTQFTANVPDSAFVLAKDGNSATLDIHAFGQSIDYIYNDKVEADDPDPDPEPVPYDDDHMIHLVWELSPQTSSRSIQRYFYAEGKDMSIYLYNYSDGLAGGHIDDVEVDQWIGTMMSMRDHSKFIPVK